VYFWYNMVYVTSGWYQTLVQYGLCNVRVLSNFGTIWSM